MTAFSSFSHFGLWKWSCVWCWSILLDVHLLSTDCFQFVFWFHYCSFLVISYWVHHHYYWLNCVKEFWMDLNASWNGLKCFGPNFQQTWQCDEQQLLQRCNASWAWHGCGGKGVRKSLCQVVTVYAMQFGFMPEQRTISTVIILRWL